MEVKVNASKNYSVVIKDDITLFSNYIKDLKGDKVAIISKGKLVFSGTIEEMKNKVGDDESLEKMFLELIDDE